MDLPAMVIEDFTRFWLLALRVSGVFFTMPLFANRAVPPVTRVLLALMTSLAILPVTGGLLVNDLSFLGWVGLAAGELLLGLVLGYLALLVFAAVQAAGQLIDLEMGFGIVSVIDPQFGQSVPLMGSFLHLLALLIFLGVDGHHQLLKVLVSSYEVVPIGGAGLFQGFEDIAVRSFSWMFEAAVRIALPVLGALFLATVALSVLARTMPQLNVFVVGIPLKILVGLLGMVVVAPFYLMMLKRLFPETYAFMARWLEGMSP